MFNGALTKLQERLKTKLLNRKQSKLAEIVEVMKKPMVKDCTVKTWLQYYYTGTVFTYQTTNFTLLYLLGCGCENYMLERWCRTWHIRFGTT